MTRFTPLLLLLLGSCIRPAPVPPAPLPVVGVEVLLTQYARGPAPANPAWREIAIHRDLPTTYDPRQRDFDIRGLIVLRAPSGVPLEQLHALLRQRAATLGADGLVFYSVQVRTTKSEPSIMVSAVALRRTASR